MGRSDRKSVYIRLTDCTGGVRSGEVIVEAMADSQTDKNILKHPFNHIFIQESEHCVRKNSHTCILVCLF